MKTNEPSHKRKWMETRDSKSGDGGEPKYGGIKSQPKRSMPAKRDYAGFYRHLGSSLRGYGAYSKQVSSRIPKKSDQFYYSLLDWCIGINCLLRVYFCSVYRHRRGIRKDFTVSNWKPRAGERVCEGKNKRKWRLKRGR